MLHMPHALCFCQVALVRKRSRPPLTQLFSFLRVHMPLSEWWASLTIAERASLAIAALHVHGRASHKKERGRFQRSLELFCCLPRGLLRRRALADGRSSTTGTSVGASDRVSLRLGGGLMVGDRASAERFAGTACAGAAQKA